MAHHPDLDQVWRQDITNIDRHYRRRVVAMRVLVLGLSGTGTNLRTALKQFGYESTYHGNAATMENPRDCEMWSAPLRAKLEGRGTLFGKEECDQLLGHCQAVTDMPAACFAKELVEAYPDAACWSEACGRDYSRGRGPGGDVLPIASERHVQETWVGSV